MAPSLTPDFSRQREILSVISRSGWEYMTDALQSKDGKADEGPRLPLPRVLRDILIELGPTFIKLGQLLSTRPDLLPPEYIDELSALQADVPAVPWELIEQTLRSELTAPLETVFRQFNPIPVAAGSLAQIYRAELASGETVAVKVQRPAIEPIVESDIGILKALADWFSERTRWGKYYDAKALAEEFAGSLRAELDFRLEGKYTDTLRANLKNSPWFNVDRVSVPLVYWQYTTRRVLVLEWIEGVPILTRPLPQNAPELAELAVKAFFQQIYIDGFFHADPHPGNLFRWQDSSGRLNVALLDCGMTGTLDPRTQQILTEQLLAIVEEDPQRFTQLALELGQVVDTVNFSRLQGEFDRLLRLYYNRSLTQINFGALLNDMLRVLRTNGVRLPGNIGLYVKALANLEGVARTLDPDFNLIETLKPLITDLFRRRLFGAAPLQEALRSALDLRTLALSFPRRFDLLLQRLTSETFQFNVQVAGVESLRTGLITASNRIALSVMVGGLILGASVVIAADPTGRMLWFSGTLFAFASLLGISLIVSILRSKTL